MSEVIITQEKLDQARKQATDPAELALAKQALQKLAKIDNELKNDSEMQALWCALRVVKKQDGAKDVRIRPGLLKQWKQVGFESLAFEQSYLTVPKQGNEQLLSNRKIAECVLDASDFDYLPAGLNVSMCYIIDKRANKLS